MQSMKDFQFESPVRNDLPTSGRYYFTQSLKYKGQDFFIPTEWFKSTGPQEAFDKKNEMLVPLQPDILNILNEIENLALRDGLKMPPDYQVTGSKEEIFKRLPTRPRLYIKVAYDVVCYNKHNQIVKFTSLGMGDYRVMIQVKGLYIGSHVTTSKLVSLQLRISQIQYIANVPTCMFSMVTVPIASDMNASEKAIPSIQQGNDTVKKSGRKPKLPRQNAIGEKSVQPVEQARVESLPSTFFDDIDISTLSAMN